MNDKRTHDEPNDEASPAALLSAKHRDVDEIRTDARRYVARAALLLVDAIGLAVEGGGDAGPEVRKLRRAVDALGKARASLEVLNWETSELVARARAAGMERTGTDYTSGTAE